MLTPTVIAQLRLQNQQIASSKFAAPEALVAWHGAKQAQDYTQAKWAIGLRVPNATDPIVEQAIEAGTIVRTHIMRPTWHFVAATDVRWMMRLTAPQIAAQIASRDRELGIDAGLILRTNDLIFRALEGGHQGTRRALAEALEQSGIKTDASRMVHIMMHAELDLVVVNGIRQGKEQTYALLDERLPPTRVFSREESLAELARRYFTSHAPATVQDFIWWSGLKVGDARTALDLIKSDLVSMPLDHLTYWMPRDLTIPAHLEPSVHLLPAFDEFLVSYKARSASLDPADTELAITSNGIFKPVLVMNGRVKGVWSKTEKRNLIEIEPRLFSPVSIAENAGIAAAAAQFGKFLGKEILIKQA